MGTNSKSIRIRSQVGVVIMPWHWEGKVRSTDFLSVSEIVGTPVVVFVSTVRDQEKVLIQVRHTRRVR